MEPKQIPGKKTEGEGKGGHLPIYNLQKGRANGGIGRKTKGVGEAKVKKQRTKKNGRSGSNRKQVRESGAFLKRGCQGGAVRVGIRKNS